MGVCWSLLTLLEVSYKEILCLLTYSFCVWNFWVNLLRENTARNCGIQLKRPGVGRASLIFSSQMTCCCLLKPIKLIALPFVRCLIPFVKNLRRLLVSPSQGCCFHQMMIWKVGRRCVGFLGLERLLPLGNIWVFLLFIGGSQTKILTLSWIE